MAEFQWKFQRRSGSATLGATLEVQQSNGRTSAVVQEITGFYLDGAKWVDELIVAHHAPLSNKPKIIRLMGDVGELDALANALAAAKPSADLRSLPREEALKKLGVVDARKLAIFVVPSFAIIAAFVISVPSIVYGFDFGEERLSVSELGSRALTSRNLVLSGELDTEHYTWSTMFKNGEKVPKDSYFPLRVPGAPKDAPIPVMLHFRGGKDALPAGDEWRCLLRDGWWDGFSDSQRSWFKKDHLNVTDATLLCDLSRNPERERSVALMTNGIALTVGLLVGVLLWFNARPRKNRIGSRA